ncbi:MAG: ABC transporter ATP-binding protein [Clostridia bacterium]|nr:ABC transporter ATP-binding protein [Clostridia bacterium]
MATVTIQNLTKSYGDHQVLKTLDVTFQDGEFVTLLGPSGCGKTTTLRLIAGFEQPTSGKIWIGDALVSDEHTLMPPEKRDIGMVFQSYAVWPHMTVFENVAYPLRIKHVAKTDVAERVNRMLSVVHLEQYAQRFPNQLSGGQQQRVALARALVAEPKLLLLDEPLSNLDAKLRESMRFEIKDLAKSLGITVVYVTHDQSEAMTMSDRIFLFNNGEVQQCGSPSEIYNHPINPFVADFLGKVSFFGGLSENGQIYLHDWEHSLPDPHAAVTGAVTVGIRPENIRLYKGDGDIQGTIEKLYYLGDTTDFRVRIGKAEVRVIMDGASHNKFAAGDKVALEIQDMMIFPDDNVQEQLRIRT